jgi:hypothetical protein
MPTLAVGMMNASDAHRRFTTQIPFFLCPNSLIFLDLQPKMTLPPKNYLVKSRSLYYTYVHVSVKRAGRMPRESSACRRRIRPARECGIFRYRRRKFPSRIRGTLPSGTMRPYKPRETRRKRHVAPPQTPKNGEFFEKSRKELFVPPRNPREKRSFRTSIERSQLAAKRGKIEKC